MLLYCRSNHYLPPHHFVEFFKSFPNLTHIDLWGSIIDDIGINSIGEFRQNLYHFTSSLHTVRFILQQQIIYFSIVGETAQKLVQLNIGKTFVTNVGIQNLCFGDDFGQYGKYTYRCPNLVILIVSETRVTGEGMYQITVDVQVRMKYLKKY